jgi:uncharacterized protein YndB with AHSA1/START domain
MSSQPQTHVLSTPGPREIVTERVFAAPRERVWSAWTDPALIVRWWGLRESETRVDELDLRPGGSWRFVELKDDGSEAAFRGVYREVSPPQRLVYTFEYEGWPGKVLVDTVELEELDGATKVVVHSLFHTTEERDGMIEAGMEKGLVQGYEALDELFAELAAREAG